MNAKVVPGKVKEDPDEVFYGFLITGTVKGAAEHVGTSNPSRKAFRRAWNELKDDGLIEWVGHTSYGLTEKGWEKAQTILKDRDPAAYEHYFEESVA